MTGSSLELTDTLKDLLKETATRLKGTERRQYMGRVVQALGPGGQAEAERELGWNRGTIRKGLYELEHGAIRDAFEQRGRKPTEARLPQLLDDIRAIVEPHTQADPTLTSQRLYTRLSAAEVRRQLMAQKGYNDSELPTAEVIRHRLNQMGYRLKRVAKAKPQKVIAETQAIFAEVNRVNEAADADDHTLRISLDAQATVNVGDYDRGGKNRVTIQAADHDFKPTERLTPFGIFLPQFNDLWLSLVTSKLTADAIVDRLEDWWQQVKHRFPPIHRWVINADNGPENHSRRTQFMARLVGLAQRAQITIQLAYYPPYHSKYNPVERTFGWLEQHWRGSLLDSVETVTRFAESLTFKDKHPTVNLVTQPYNTGIKLTQPAMAELEKSLHRLPGLEKWFVEIVPTLAS
jgi:hypothetical protein